MSSNIQEVKRELQDLTQVIRIAKSEIVDYKVVLSGTLSLMQTAGLPPHVRDAVSMIQRLVSLLYAAQSALYAYYFAAGPKGWAMAAISGAAAALSWAGFISTASRTR